MKSFRYRLFKRIFIYCLCTTLIFSNIFISYSMTVCATEYSDLLRDGAEVALSALGIYATVQSGGALSLPLLIPYIERLAGTGFDVYDYITQNEDGTTTISEDFVQLVLQAYEGYKEDESLKFNGAMAPGEDGYYHYDSITSVKFWEAMSDVNFTCTFTDINTYFPCAILVYSNRPCTWDSDTSRIHRGYTIFYDKNKDMFYSTVSLVENLGDGDEIYLDDIGISLESSLFLNKAHYVRKYIVSGRTESGEAYLYPVVGSSGNLPSESYVQVSSSSIPVYHNLSSLKEGLRTGDFSAAYNYGASLKDFESSKYTGNYSGGDITVSTEKLNGIQGKLDEINETDKSIDDKLKDLLDWLGIGDGIGGGVTGGSWYDQILAYLDKILKQLKSIKRWTIVDTVINGVDAIADWLDLIHDILSDVDDGMESAVATLSSALDDSMGLMKKKFPFSIPWDILFFVTVLSAEPEVPQFSIPFDFEVSALDLEVHYDMELDFTPFQWLSDLSRLLLSMTYAVGLMKMTFNVSNMGKEG